MAYSYKFLQRLANDLQARGSQKTHLPADGDELKSALLIFLLWVQAFVPTCIVDTLFDEPSPSPQPCPLFKAKPWKGKGVLKCFC